LACTWIVPRLRVQQSAHFFEEVLRPGLIVGSQLAAFTEQAPHGLDVFERECSKGTPIDDLQVHELSAVARFNRRQIAVFRLDGTHSRHNVEELEEKNETQSRNTTL
jgi:hypothetical protein